MKKYKIFAINPGSTSTKVAMYENETEVFSAKAIHTASKYAELNRFEHCKETILETVTARGIDLKGVDAFAGRGGGMMPLEGGVYLVNDLMVEHCRNTTLKHPAVFGPGLVADMAKTYGGKAFVVNPPDVDEMVDIARITGFRDIYRGSQFHALNQKEIAVRAAKEMGKQYSEVNFVIAHIGGGVSVTAHQKGRAIDTSSNIMCDGPMTPTRAGTLPIIPFMELCFSGKYSREEMSDRLLISGGFVDHLGTSDMLEIKEMIAQGNEYARLVYEAFIYQIAKSIGSFAVALRGEVDAILLTGGIVNDTNLVARLKEMVGFIAPIRVYPGEFEMEALAHGALRVLRGEEAPKKYTGVPVFSGFNFCKD
ncbi:MAG: butyrate kinase [Peptococcaceae bacterium]|jgi:butyrate kinase|nr:butyrate kinase [Peptococcaceae bacterium]MDH7525436.1 butyrate kinase [Peptococcaceae bacterium]